jgi:hypothetical protein
MVDTLNQVFVHTVEYLIDFSFIEIKHPLNLIPKTPADNCSEPDDFSNEEGFNSEHSVSGLDDIKDRNDHNEERENPP